MKQIKHIVASCFLLAGLIANAQNLVPNNGFETYSALPTGVAQTNLSTGWTSGTGSGSPDYFHTSGSGLVQLPNAYFGTVNPYAGNALWVPFFGMLEHQIFASI